MSIRLLIFSLCVFLACVPAAAQEQLVPASAGRRAVSPDGLERRSSVEDRTQLWQQRLEVLKKYLATVSPSSPDHRVTQELIAEIERNLSAVKTAPGADLALSDEVTSRTASQPLGDAGAGSRIAERGRSPAALAAQSSPVFSLARPANTATNESTQLTLGWTEDQQTVVNYKITKFIVEVAIDPSMNPNGSFVTPVFRKEEDPEGTLGQSIGVPEKKLAAGEKYHWQVLARYMPQDATEVPGAPDKYLPAGGQLVPPSSPGAPPTEYLPAAGAAALPLPSQSLKSASNAPRTFGTAATIFDKLEEKGFTLQKTVAGPDATEGAEFGFLNTIGDKTVYTANFALINDRPLKVLQNNTLAVALQTSVQGALTSDESESEDALQFRAAAVLDKELGDLDDQKLDGFYLSLGAKYETDQKFTVGKFMSESMFTPTLHALKIGRRIGPKNVGFTWRPFFNFNVGHTFKRGDTSEVENTILRLAPRVRARFSLDFIRIALNLADAFIYVDDTFYYLPLETKKRRNFFTSGLNFQVTDNFGFGFTYKNGESAPKFKRINTFGGVLTVRFGG